MLRTLIFVALLLAILGLAIFALPSSAGALVILFLPPLSIFILPPIERDVLRSLGIRQTGCGGTPDR